MVAVTKYYPAGKLTGNIDVNGYALDNLMLPTVVVGPDEQSDIWIDESDTTEITKIADAITMLMSRSSNKGGVIFMKPFRLNNVDGDELYIHHADGAGVPISIIGSGVSPSADTPPYYGGGTEWIMPTTENGIKIGAFGNNSIGSGVLLKNFCVRTPVAGVGGSGIYLGADGYGAVSLEDMLFRYFDIGVDFYSHNIYSRVLQRVRTENCHFGMKVSGYNNLLESCYGINTAPAGHSLGDCKSFVISGTLNKLSNCDAGAAGYGVQIEGDKNIVDQLWTEAPCINPIYIPYTGQRNFISGLVGYHAEGGGISCHGGRNHFDVRGTAICFNEISPTTGHETECIENEIIRDCTYTGTIVDTGTRTRKNCVTFLPASPGLGSYLAGDFCGNSAPASGQPKGWVCTVGGTPGTWSSIGNL